MTRRGLCRHDALYMCSRCGECYQCDHTINLARLTWRCRDGVEKPAVPDGEKRVWLGMKDDEIKGRLRQWIEGRMR